ncbi:MAG TPA: trypsin-like peptidase domain-containing protein [Acidimicrobiales bacterium]|nr:trypsin-like peptidase domain-containing protein [Acidimicrobiales bacterium]
MSRAPRPPLPGRSRAPRAYRRPAGGWRRAADVGVAAAIVVAVAGCTSTSHRSGGTGPSTTSTVKPAAAQSAADLEQTYVKVVARVRPEVVQISTSEGLGSGVVYDTRGDIVTNAHVVGTATSFTVRFLSGQTVPATVVGVYAPDDLAVIRVQGARDLSPATFGESRTLQVGDIVLAIGNPLGLSSSVTDGIISYNGRPVSEGNGVTLASTIQTSAAINPGNSGGALADLNGDVIGIPTLAAVNQQGGGAAAGIGFAIPSDTVKLIVPQLIDSGRVTRSGRAALGISAADAVGSSGNPAGVQIVGVNASGPAAAAGIVAGDVITAVGSTPVTNLADLQAALAQLAPGQRTTLTVVDQSGNRRDVTVVLGQLAG